MSKEKQIEEMALLIHKLMPIGLELSAAVATDLYNAGYRKQEWISVDERLPEKSDFYLANIISHFGTDFVTLLPYSSALGWGKHEVTHWMPLPEAPKGGAE